MKAMEIIVRDEIMLRSGHFIDNRQLGFLIILRKGRRLFNSYFYRQFFEPSSYDITVDHTYNHEFYIDFNSNRISTILSTLNPNKAIWDLIKYMD